ncbi:MAG: ribokinase [Sphaerochaetaceae bacterium]|jgi:ribokinase
MAIVNFGSINIDKVFTVDSIVVPKETIHSRRVDTFTGGKGANQSVAVAKSGYKEIYHAGLIGSDGSWIIDKLSSYKVDTRFIETIKDHLTGQAMIQVDSSGQNAIVLYGGANHSFTHSYVDTVLDHFDKGSWVLLQNEINLNDYILKQSYVRGLNVVLNPAPYDSTITDLSLEYLSVLALNEVEAEGLSGLSDPLKALEKLCSDYPKTAILITVGPHGVLYGKGRTTRYSYGTWDVPVVDTTAAGDTFIGYLVSSLAQGLSVEEALHLSSAASNLTIMTHGAMDSIPTIGELSRINEYTKKEFSLP